MTLRDVAIVGVAESELGITGASIAELQTQAVTRALAEAGLTPADVDGFATNGAARFSVTAMAEYLGIQPRWTDSTFAGGASYEIFVGHAATAIATGQAEVVVIAYGSNQRSASSRSLGGVVEAHVPDAQFDAPYGPLQPISAYALAADRHMYTHGTTRAQLAEVAVAAREWALLNPIAYRHDEGPLTVADVLESRPLSTPLSALDCCLVTDGGGAVVLTSLDRARDLPTTPVQVLGFAETTTHNAISQAPDLLQTGAAVTGPAALAAAGVDLADIDVAQLYDSFTITVLLTLESLGFCGPGEAGAFVEDGRIAPGGGFPLNTSGGGLSYCHPGMFGIFLLIEAVRQLRGEAGARQVGGAELALCHGTGGILSTHATTILGIDR
ncbi:acetyl-CoA acetyltransferase [Euzebya tangerina]|uniref:acetyl-CoA acetyltransferase n=1 Tax=Euzebya tangerina TaxID=591198 RepID=UPI000E31766F|nr:acetyl-CoA acetyltransferase [Euzebya tangerina]